MDKKKVFGILFIIVALSILLRLININKPEGMWNDEYLTWEIAKAAFPKEFFEAIMRNCHAPLHYLYLKVWMYFFGDTDLSLRLSSLITGVLSVIMMFFTGRLAGKKLSDSNGLIAAGFCSISSFLIYFSQEVRIYSLLFLLTSINLYFALKTLDEPSKKNCTFFILTSLLIMLEHTIGFVYVFFSAIGVILFASKKNKFKKFFLTTLLIALIAFIPVGIFLYGVMFNQEYFSQWWAPFSFAKLAFFFTDLFSPYLINITNAPPLFMSMIYDNGVVNYGFILFALVPLLISAIFIIRGICSFDKNIKYFLLVSLGMYFTVFAASCFGKIVFLTKYMTEIYPALILLFVVGISAFKSKGFKITILTVYSVISLFFILVSNYSPVKLIREEGQRIPVVMLQSADKKPEDKVLFLYYPKNRFSKYDKTIEGDKNVFHISKYDFTFIKDDNEKMVDTFKNGKKTYKNVFLASKNKGLDLFLEKNIFSGIKNGDRFFLVDFPPVTIFSKEGMFNILSSEQKYNETPFLYLAFSYIRNYIFDKADIKLSLNDVIEYEGWRVFVFEKT